MKRLLPVVLLVLASSGCAAAPEAIPAEVYHELAGEYFTESSTENLDRYAEEICTVMEGGDMETSWLYGVKYLTDAGMDAGEAGKYLVYAASYSCPEMLERFPEG
ncbi:hypothetical protein [Agromyces ramosus]|nr:hypothetical protein [Agromyces ramosus]